MTSPPPSGRILLGEEVRVTAARLQEAFREAGFSVEVATGSADFLKSAQAAPPDLALINFQMPRMHGVEVARLLMQNPDDIGLMLFVPRGLQLEPATLATLHGVELLGSPFEISEVVARVVDFFERRKRAAASGAPAKLATPKAAVFKPHLDAGRGRFSLWGTRGSTPTPGARFLRHGGNTSCLSVTFGEEKFIFDAGSGIRDLGMALLGQTSRKLHLFITHTHWDHIQGFPFFAPAYSPGFEIGIYGAQNFGKNLESVFRGQLDREYFPVQMEDLNSSIQFRHLEQNPVHLGGAKLSWVQTQHPGTTLGYKLEMDGFVIAWVPDNEFLKGYTGSPEGLTMEDERVAPYRPMIEFLSGVDVLIHEAQYTNDEYPEKVGWGHSSVSNGCLLAKFAGIRRWIITHHDPIHDDAFLENKLNITRQILALIGHSCQVSHGYDGQTEYF